VSFVQVEVGMCATLDNEYGQVQPAFDEQVCQLARENDERIFREHPELDCFLRPFIPGEIDLNGVEVIIDYVMVSRIAGLKTVCFPMTVEEAQDIMFEMNNGIFSIEEWLFDHYFNYWSSIKQHRTFLL